MAQTDPNDVIESQRSGRRWSFAGFLTGVRASFGLGGKNIITASANGASKAPQNNQQEVLIAKKSIAAQGEKYWTRMALSEAKLKMWRNDFREELDLKLRETFHPENFKRMTLLKHTSTNLLQRLVHDISITYESPPRRFFKEDVAAEKPEPTKPEETNNPIPPKPEDNPVIPSKDVPPVEAKPTLDTGIPEIDALADELDLEGAQHPKEDDILKKLAEHSNLDMLMENVEMFSRFLPCVWIRPMVQYDEIIETIKTDAEGNKTSDVAENPTSGRLNYVIYTPDIADVVVDPSNPNRIIGFWYYSYELNDRGEMAKFVNFWTDSAFIKLDSDWNILTTDDNPYGIIPIASVKLGMSSPNCFFVDGQGDDIYEGSLELCVLKTIQNCRARDSGFKQLAISGDPKDTPADQVLGGPTPFYTGDGGTVSVLDMQPYIDQWTALCESRGQELSAKYGISAAEYKAEGTPQSGFAKKLDRDKVMSINRRGRKYFLAAEKSLYEVTKKVLEARPVPAIGVLPDKTLEIDFAEPSFEEDPKEQATTDAQRIKLGIDSILDILKRENPDLTEVELLKLAAKKKRINDAFITKTASSLLDILAQGGKPPGAPGAGGGFGEKKNPTDGNPNLK